MACILIRLTPVRNRVLPGFQVQLMEQALITKQDICCKKVGELIDIILGDFTVIVTEIHDPCLSIGKGLSFTAKCCATFDTGFLTGFSVGDLPDKTPCADKIASQRIFLFR